MTASVCSRCEHLVPWTGWVKNSARSTGRGSYCKACHSEMMQQNYSPDTTKLQQVDYVLQKKYGVGLNWYESKLQEQGGSCALCPAIPTDTRRLNVDHDHATGRVRGLLCNQCNNALERLDNIPGWAKAAACYLED